MLSKQTIGAQRRRNLSGEILVPFIVISIIPCTSVPNKCFNAIFFSAEEMKLSLVKQRKGKENALFSLHLTVTTHWFLILDILIVFYLYFCYYHPLKAQSFILNLLPLCQCSLYSRNSKIFCCSRWWSLFYCVMASFCLFLLSPY